MVKKKFRFIKKFFIIFLCSLILSTTILSDFSRTNTVKAIVGVDDACVLIAMLAMFGIYVSYTWVTDGNNALDLYDELEEAYNTKRFEVIQGGAGGDPDEDNGDDNNNNDDIPPDFETLYNSALTKGQLELNTNIASCLAIGALSVWNTMYNFGSSLAEERYKNELGGLDDIIFTHDVYAILTHENDFSLIYERSSNELCNRVVFVECSDGNFCTIYSTEFKPNTFLYRNGEFESSSGFGYVKTYKYKGKEFCIHQRSTGKYVKYFTTTPILHTSSTHEHWDNFDWDYIYDYIVGNKNPTVLKTTPENEEEWESGTGIVPLEVPDNTTYPIEIPEPDRLREIDTALSPEPDPDTGIIPDIDYDPLRKLFRDLRPDSDPDPNPNPDPDPNPDPNPDIESFDKVGLTANLTELFPFCIPFDLIRAIKLFNHEPETPHIEWTLNVKPIHYSYTFVIDLHDFDSVAVICRLMFLILFIFGLILATRGLIKG